MEENLQKSIPWIFDGIGVLFIATFLSIIGYIIKRALENHKPASPNPITITNSLTAYGAVSANTALSPTTSESKTNNSVLKQKRQILFIDDDVRFKIVSILKKMGWLSVSIIKDVESLECELILKSDIIFVDIQGVGKKLGFKEEGLGLVQALKQHYGDSKKVVIYSAVEAWDPFKDGFRLADDRLRKNAEPYEFEKVITELLS